MAVTPAYDVGGFGRLAQINLAKQAGEREDRRIDISERRVAIDEALAEQKIEMGDLQLAQMENNMKKIKRDNMLKSGLSKVLQNIPEGENKFTTAYNYFMMQGAPDYAEQYMDKQSDFIDSVYEKDKEEGIRLYNDTIGRVTGSTAKFSKEDPVVGDILKIKDKDGNEFLASRTKSGKIKPLPEGYDIVEDPKKRTKAMVDLALEDEVTKRFQDEQGIDETDARLRAQSFIADNKRGKGISLSYDENGKPVLSIGGKVASGPITKSVKTQVQKDILEANKTYSDMRAVTDRLDDKFLEMPTRLGTKWTSIKEKWKIGKIKQEDRDELEAYTDFRRESIASLNNYIKQITGAAMSELEAKRLMKAMPNPGMGLFDGDSPTEFKTKLNGVMKSLDRAIARLNYVNKVGLESIESVSLEQMDGIIDDRGIELENIIKKENPNASTGEIEKMVIDRLSKEFGMRF